MRFEERVVEKVVDDCTGPAVEKEARVAWPSVCGNGRGEVGLGLSVAPVQMASLHAAR